jgi:hypothetical protein
MRYAYCALPRCFGGAGRHVVISRLYNTFVVIDARFCGNELVCHFLMKSISSFHLLQISGRRAVARVNGHEETVVAVTRWPCGAEIGYTTAPTHCRERDPG